ncbi:MAG: hypothetical protein GC162_08885 [Planctomycetes bacterium]|nr:hypothetical protein [Planctomycetota bacterium]
MHDASAHDLLAAMLDDELAPAQWAQLDAMLSSDAAARRAYIEHMALHADLVISTQVAVEPAEADDVAPAATLEGVRRWRRPRAMVGGFLAGMVLLAAALWSMRAAPSQKSAAPRAVRDTTASVAMLTDAQDAVFSESGSAPALGSALKPGVIELASGRAQVMFNSTAVVDLVGPCSFELDGPNRGVLHSGKLHALVGERARGFTVTGPGLTVIDLGTRFELDVHDAMHAEVNVIEGKVLFRAEYGEAAQRGPVTLVAGQALSLAAGQVTVRLAAVRADGIWTFDHFDKGTSAEMTERFGPAMLQGATADPRGVSGQAVAFDGRGNRVDLNTTRLVPERGPFGMFMWMRTERGPDDQPFQYLISNYVSSHPGRFALAMRDGRFAAFCGGWQESTRVAINDGQWHHVGLTRDDHGTMTFWIDGRAHHGGKCDDPVGGDGDAWLLGGRAMDQERSFHGLIDQLVVFDREPTPREVQALYRNLDLRPTSGSDDASQSTFQSEGD